MGRSGYRVLIVGCGEIGSRHLQAVASLPQVSEIEVVDPRPEALELGRERPQTIPRAIRAYQKATELNPRAVGAFINLGTIHYHQGSIEDAERSYRAALALNPDSALVHFNLGNLLEEKGQFDAARNQYEESIRLDSRYPDPRFNLALVFERLGQHGKACQQWRAYLKLDSETRWAAYARKKLAQIPLRVVSPANPHNERG